MTNVKPWEDKVLYPTDEELRLEGLDEILIGYFSPPNTYSSSLLLVLKKLVSFAHEEVAQT